MANYDFRRFMNMLGFVASMLISVALLVALFVSLASGDSAGIIIPGFEFGGIIADIVLIANAIAYIMVLIAGFNYAKSKRSVWYMVAQVVATLVIIVLLVVTNIF